MFAEQIQTATMASTLVSSLRSAVTNGDPNYDEVMDFYYDKINPGSSDYEEGDGDDWREDRASYEPINKYLIFKFSFTKYLSDFLLQENKIKIF